MKVVEKEQEKVAKKSEKLKSKRDTAALSTDQHLETYCLLRGLEMELKVEDCYDFVKFMLNLQDLKEKLKSVGVANLIPVGSAVTKTIRKEAFMIDIILNYNKS